MFEPHVGGHIYDIGVDGSRCQWARILAYEPPSRVIFTWDVGPTCQIENDFTKTSEVEVRFIVESGERTRVTYAFNFGRPRFGRVSFTPDVAAATRSAGSHGQPPSDEDATHVEQFRRRRREVEVPAVWPRPRMR